MPRFLMLLPLLALQAVADLPPATIPPVLGGYVTAWTSKEQVQAMGLTNYTHLFHAFLRADPEGSLLPDRGLPAGWLVEHGHRSGCLVLASLGGGAFPHFPAIAGDEGRRRHFIRQVIERVVTVGYDGVDLDWEFPDSAATAASWSLLITELRAALTEQASRSERKTPYLLTAAVSGAAWAGNWLDADIIRDQMDFLNVMTYDFAGQWGGKVGPHAALFSPPDDPKAHSIANAMRYWHERRKIPREKLVVGIPFYSYIFHDSQAGERLRSGHGRKVNAIKWRDLTALVQKEKWIQAPDPVTGTLTCTSPDGSRLAGIDTPAIVGRKTTWSLQEGYRGIFVWELNQEKPTVDDSPLTAAIRSAVDTYLRHRNESQPPGPTGGP